ncbi:MAG: hypothetical protein A2Z20_04495 [Bdellovibrionales bacterium RBG_16_40_8]|nr:MAG: hypothetical protein A2Z20_04495 [Bdellovibrionales bacterium RBG_16_40_8]
MNKRFIFLISIFVIFFSAVIFASDNESILAHFDHDLHNTKAFPSLNFKCSKCHNVKEDSTNKQITLEPDLEKATFRVKTSELCHQCHKTTDSRYSAVPKACTICHRAIENLQKIKPLNHSNVSWKQGHATQARITGNECLSCHSKSTCTKCHLQRNENNLVNHDRNFRFYHSVQARLEPHRCTSCHTQSYCVKCHLGGR